MTEPKKEEKAPTRPAPAAAPAMARDADPARNEAELRKRAMKHVAEHRKECPRDARTDEELLAAPNGGYELATLDLQHERHMAERKARLAYAARDEGEETPKEKR